MNDLYAWMAQQPDGTWAQVGGLVPGLGMTNFVHIHQDLLQHGFPRQMVEQASRQNGGRPVRLVRYVAAETLEEI